jgi:DNA (cytosine-5)-methyltransferase 1
LEAAGLSSTDEIDVVFGGPPCQGFSLIGHRSLEDPRNRLVHEFVRLVKELKAKYFVFENVKGLTVGRQRAFLDELIAAFEAAGYVVRLPWQVLDAADFGVPQHRDRLILMGARRGLPLPSYPRATHSPADDVRPLDDIPRGPSVADAIGDLPNADAFEALLASDKLHHPVFSSPTDYASEMRTQSNEAWHLGYRRKWDTSVLTGFWRTDHSAISRRRFAETKSGETEPISRFYKLKANGLSNTLRAGTDSARGAFTSPRPIHYFYDRCITVREMARLHGFPDWFRLHATKWHGARQIGNAVPPPLGRSIGGAIRGALGAKVLPPRKAIALGDETLLYVTVVEAAEMLGVSAPMQRRDRKSGATKRKQHETEAERLALLRVAAE